MCVYLCIHCSASTFCLVLEKKHASISNKQYSVDVVMVSIYALMNLYNNVIEHLCMQLLKLYYYLYISTYHQFCVHIIHRLPGTLGRGLHS